MGTEDIRISEIEANTRLAETRQNAQVAEAYLTAMRNRNVTAIGQMLHPQFSYVAPTGETHGPAPFLETLQRAFNNAQKIEVTPHLATGDQTAHLSTVYLAPSTNPIVRINVLTHQDGLIKKIKEIDESKFSPEQLRPENENRSPPNA